MSQPHTVAARARCPRCRRALPTCICALARAVPHAAQVLILQHPMEVRETKGTGRLLQLCLPHSRLLEGEHFEPGLLEQALHGDWGAGDERRTPLLLYPDTPQQDAALGLARAAPLPAPWPLPTRRLRLVVLDGTWRKSRKMLYLNPALQPLPRLALRAAPATGYAIRKAHAPGQLSTLEATALALADLERWSGRHSPLADLLGAFHAFVAGQQALRDKRCHATLPEP